MGTAFSSKKESSVKCKICNEHCCYKECYKVSEQEFKNELLSVLDEKNLGYTVDIILGYIGALNIVEMEAKHTNEGYHAYVHSIMPRIYLKDKCKHSPFANLRSLYKIGNVRFDRAANYNEYKIVVLGHCGVGKSALVIRLITDNFLNEYDPTIEDSYRCCISVENVEILLDILDTAGREEFSSMEDQWIREGKIFLLLFAINDELTFKEAIHKRERILMNKPNEYVPMILVGTKCDLLLDEENKNQKFVDRNMVIEKANEFGMPYIETSSKFRKNVDFLFKYCYYETRIQEMLERHDGM